MINQQIIIVIILHIIFYVINVTRKEKQLEIAHKVIAHSLKDMLGEEDPLSNCCAASFTYPGWPDSDFCSECHEHAGIDEDDDAEAKTIGVEDGKS